jgi:hypothetical protein
LLEEALAIIVGGGQDYRHGQVELVTKAEVFWVFHDLLQAQACLMLPRRRFASTRFASAKKFELFSPA